MALSFSRPDPSQPSSVSSASFAMSRRGYDQAEVRDFLRMVAAELARLQEREKFLEHELRVAQRNGSSQPAAFDEEVLTRMLGEEAARILQAARDGAAAIKLRAEEHCQRIVREVTEEAERLRIEVDQETQRRRQDSMTDAEAEISLAKQQGREMVNEAREYREKVLAELARRRDLARQQIEQLAHGRDRLVQAFERARIAAVDVLGELAPLIEPEEYVNLTPTTGPVPLMVPNRAAGPTTPQSATAESAPLEATAPVGNATEVEGSTRIYDVEAETDELAPGGVDDNAVDEADGAGGEASAADEEAGAEELAADDGASLDVHEVDVVGDGDADADDDAGVAATADVMPEDLEPITAEIPVIVVDAGDAVDNSSVEAVSAVGSRVDAEGGDLQSEDHTAGDDRIDGVANDQVDGSVVADMEATGQHDADEHDEHDEHDDRPIAPVVALFGSVDQKHSAPPPAAPPAPPRPSVDDLFARLRAARPEAVAERVDAALSETAAPRAKTRGRVVTEKIDGAKVVRHVDVTDAASSRSAAVRAGHPSTSDEPSPRELRGSAASSAAPSDDDGETPFTRRDAVVSAVAVAAARSLKRVLADEQNDILERLRRKEPVRTLDAVVPTSADHIAVYLDAVGDDLMAAALAGAASLDDATDETHRAAVVAAGALDAAREHLANTLIDPLRERIDRVIADAAGSNDDIAQALRTLYREWKGHRIDDAVSHAVHAAFGHGALAAVAPGTLVMWAVDPNGPASADCDDNALAGAVPAGEAFPTEHLCAPAHLGCRCMLVRASR